MNIYKNRNFAKLGVLPNSVFPNAVTSCTAIITFKYYFQVSSTVYDVMLRDDLTLFCEDMNVVNAFRVTVAK